MKNKCILLKSDLLTYMRHILCVFGIVFFVVVHAEVKPNESLQTLLMYVEDSCHAQQIINSYSDILKSDSLYDSDFIVECYLLYPSRLRYDSIRRDWKLEFGWSDSVFFKRSIEYTANIILKDTALDLVSRYLYNNYLMPLDYSSNSIVHWAKEIVNKFHSTDALGILTLHYYNKMLTHDKDEYEHAEALLTYYKMLEYVLRGNKRTFHYSPATIIPRNTEWFNTIEVKGSYYHVYRNEIKQFTNIQLARLSSKDNMRIQSLLQQGIDNGEEECIIVWAFMKITGCFVEKNIEEGKRILCSIWPDMTHSFFWEYIK